MLAESVRILVCTIRQDMRRSFDTLAQAVREHLGEEPQRGTLYVFVGKRPTRVKVLWWEPNGYCLLYKRLHRALICEPDTEPVGNAWKIDGAALGQLLTGVACEERNRRTRVRLH